MSQPVQQLCRWIGYTALLTYLVIIIGAATRVADAGMACPDWPMCYGQFVPFPEPASGYIVNGTHYVWWQVLLEWGHRLLASLTGILLLTAMFFAFRARQFNPRSFYFSFIPLLLLIIQVKLGGITVWFSNIHWSVAAHLGCALLFFASLIWWRKQAALPQSPTLPKTSRVQRITVWLLTIFVFLTMLVGAMVSSSHAGGVCGGLASCLGHWWPSDWGQMLHMKHRFIALITFVLMLLFFFSSRKTEASLQRMGKGLLILTCVQVLLGILTLYSFAHYPMFYMPFSVIHLGWGVLLWMACNGALGKIYWGLEGGFHDRKRNA